MLMAGCVAAPMRLPTHSVDVSGRKGRKPDFSFLKAGETNRAEMDRRLKQFDTNFWDSQLLWRRYLESNWGVGVVTVGPSVGGGRVWPEVLASFNSNASFAKEWFGSLEDARQKLAKFREHYNHQRPHSALGDRAPVTFAEEMAALRSPTARSEPHLRPHSRVACERL